jgi:uncharacterized protein
MLRTSCACTDWISRRILDAEGLQQAEASRALVDQKIDAFFYTVGNPTAAIEEPAQSVDLDMVPLNSDAIRAFVARASLITS